MQTRTEDNKKENLVIKSSVTDMLGKISDLTASAKEVENMADVSGCTPSRSPASARNHTASESAAFREHIAEEMQEMAHGNMDSHRAVHPITSRMPENAAQTRSFIEKKKASRSRTESSCDRMSTGE